MKRIHLDTSVLASRYLADPLSDAVELLMMQPGTAFSLSELALVEIESAVARRRREPGGSGIDAAAVRLRFDSDLSRRFFDVVPLNATVLAEARRLIAEGVMPIATLDAIHLSTALGIHADALATDDRQLARASEAAGLPVIPLR